MSDDIFSIFVAVAYQEISSCHCVVLFRPCVLVTSRLWSCEERATCPFNVFFRNGHDKNSRLHGPRRMGPVRHRDYGSKFDGAGGVFPLDYSRIVHHVGSFVTQGTIGRTPLICALASRHGRPYPRLGGCSSVRNAVGQTASRLLERGMDVQ